VTVLPALLSKSTDWWRTVLGVGVTMTHSTVSRVPTAAAAVAVMLSRIIYLVRRIPHATSHR